MDKDGRKKNSENMRKYTEKGWKGRNMKGKEREREENIQVIFTGMREEN